MILCPCQKDRSYQKCCHRFHEGLENPKTPLELMKSRYSAYAMRKYDYIIETTHPKNPYYNPDFKSWKSAIEENYGSVDFKNLEIISHHHDDHEGYVTFKAHLQQHHHDVSFEEKSRFVYENFKWMYLDGQINSLKK